MSLVLKSNSLYKGEELAKGFNEYKARVLADGGDIYSEAATRDVFLFAKTYGIDGGIGFSVTSPNWGAKVTDGNIVKLYSLFGETGDQIVTGGSYGSEVVGGIRTLMAAASSASNIETANTVDASDMSITVIYKPNAPNIPRPLSAFYTIGGSVIALRLYRNTDGSISYSHAGGVLQSGSVPTSLNTDKVESVSVLKNGYRLSLLYFDEVTDEFNVPSSGVVYSVKYSPVRDGNKTGMDGNLFESWALVGADLEHVKAIGLRAKNTYL